MLHACSPESDVAEAIERLEAEARAIRRECENAVGETESCILRHRAEKLEELIEYLRDRLP